MAATVLLVEDNHDNREIYRTLLEHLGYAVLEAEDGEEGVRIAQEQMPAVILMDVSLPRMNGYTATGVLKSQDRTSRIPVIALTAHAMEGEEARARKAGCDGYLAKPVEPRRVAEEIARFIGPA